MTFIVFHFIFFTFLFSCIFDLLCFCVFRFIFFIGNDVTALSLALHLSSRRTRCADDFISFSLHFYSFDFNAVYHVFWVQTIFSRLILPYTSIVCRLYRMLSLIAEKVIFFIAFPSVCVCVLSKSDEKKIRKTKSHKLRCDWLVCQ